jgi:hypothetical protein
MISTAFLYGTIVPFAIWYWTRSGPP